MRDQQILLAYWLGELDDAESAAAEEHFFGCAYCTRRWKMCAAWTWCWKTRLRE